MIRKWLEVDGDAISLVRIWSNTIIMNKDIFFGARQRIFLPSIQKLLRFSLQHHEWCFFNMFCPHTCLTLTLHSSSSCTVSAPYRPIYVYIKDNSLKEKAPVGSDKVPCQRLTNGWTSNRNNCGGGILLADLQGVQTIFQIPETQSQCWQKSDVGIVYILLIQQTLFCTVSVWLTCSAAKAVWCRTKHPWVYQLQKRV